LFVNIIWDYYRVRVIMDFEENGRDVFMGKGEEGGFEGFIGGVVKN
jgi:hypothetical protein